MRQFPLLVALVVASPARAAIAVTAAQAEAAVQAAVAGAKTRGEQIAVVPVQFAGALVIERYGVELPEFKGVNAQSPSDSAIFVAAKKKYWEDVAAALKREKQRLSTEMDGAQKYGLSTEETIAHAAAVVRLAREEAAANAIAADASADFDELIKKKPVFGLKLIDRKIELFAELAHS